MTELNRIAETLRQEIERGAACVFDFTPAPVIEVGLVFGGESA